MDENRRMLLILGILTVLTIGAITYIGLRTSGYVASDAQMFSLVFENATGIPDNADVRVAGIKIGSVQDMELAPGGAAVIIAIEPDFPVYSDAKAIIKSKSLLGERFIELQPGSIQPELESGAVIQDTVTPLRLEDLGEIMGPLFTNIDANEVQEAMQAMLDVFTENKEAFKEGGRALGILMTRLNRYVSSDEDMARLGDFMDSMTDLVIRLDNLTGKNEKELEQTLVSLAKVMADFETISAQMKEMSADFPEYGGDLGGILKKTNDLLEALNKFDSKRASLILKKVLQQEGLTFSVRGYSMEELREQMDEYEEIYATGGTASE